MDVDLANLHAAHRNRPALVGANQLRDAQDMSDERPTFEPLPEDWERALCVVAHPDDLEFGAAAAVARWTGQGKEVVYCMVTSGEAGIDGLHPDECRPVREAEQVESARVVGVDEVEFLGLPDGILEYGVAAARAPSPRWCAGTDRRSCITGNFRDTWGGRNLNQADHIAVGRAVLDAVRDAGNRWVFPEQLDGGLEPWGGVGAVWAFGSPRVAPRRRHHRHLRPRRRLARGAPRPTSTASAGRTSTPREFLEGMARATGQRLGVAFAGAVRGLPDGLGRLRLRHQPDTQRDGPTATTSLSRALRPAPPVGLEPTTLRLTAECSAS